MPLLSEDAQFIEVSQITIIQSGHRKFRPKGGDYRVVIKHVHGREETIRSSEDGKRVTIECNRKTFIQLGTETTIQIRRARKLRIEADNTFTIPASTEEETGILVIGNETMNVTLQLGKKKTMAEVVKVRVDDANEVLEEESNGAEDLDRLTGHVKVLVDLLEVVANFDPFKYAEAAVSIAKIALERMRTTHEEYTALKDAAETCMNQIQFDGDARKVFTTERVREKLNSAMASVLKALEFIFDFYSQPRITAASTPSQRFHIFMQRQDRFISRLTKPPDSTIVEVTELTNTLAAQKGEVKDAFEVEIRAVLQKVVDVQFEENLAKIAATPEGKQPCLPGTRSSILERMSSWAESDSLAKVDSTATSRLFWLYGVAGCGKSAVAVSTSQTLAGAKLLAGVFFCRRDVQDQRSPIQLFSHLATCLAEKCPHFKAALDASLKEYRSLNNNILSVFFEYAFKKQFSVANNFPPSHSITFIVDALDECDQSSTVASYLAEIITAIPWIKLIVTSRETLEIKKAFSDSNIPRSENDLLKYDAENDIQAYFIDRLRPFPSLRVFVDKLCKKSGGLFIWAHTVTEVIIDDKLFQSERNEKVNAILEKPLSGTAEERMVETYLFILEQASRSSATGIRMEVVRMIVGLLLATSSNTPLTTSGFYAFLPPYLAEKLSTEEFANLVMELKPVLKLTPVEDSSEAVVDEKYRFFVQTYHASFLDFCEKQTIPYKTDSGIEERSNPFWTDPTELHGNMAGGCFEIMKKGKWCGKPEKALFGLGFNICSLETSHKLNSEVSDLQERIESKISRHLLYSSLYWADHVLKSTPDGSAVDIDIQGALREFLETTRSLFWLEVLSLTGNLAEGIEALIAIAVDTKTKAFDLIANEMSRFVEQCFPAISCSTPHLYLSLAWLPVESLLWRAWKTEFAGTSVLKTPIRQPSELLSSTPFPVRVDVFAVSSEGKYVATGSRDGHVRLWNMRSGSLIKDRQMQTAISALAYEPGGSHILCVCAGFIYKLNTESLSDIEDRESIPYDNVRCIANIRGQVAFGTEDGRVVISTSAKLYSEVKVRRRERVEAIALSPDGSHLVYAANDVYFCKRDVGGVYKDDGGYLNFYYWVTALAFSPDGSKIAIANWGGVIRLVDAESREEIGYFDVESPIQFLTFSYGNRIIAAIASKKGEMKHSEDLPPSSEASRIYNFRGVFNFLGYHFWAEETSLQIWNVDFSGRQQTESAGHILGVTSVAFSPDGKKIVSGSGDFSVRVWDAQTGEQIKLAEMKHSDSDRVSFVTFSPNGKSIASGGDNKFVRIWDAVTGNPVRVLEGHANWVLCGAYSPDGTRLVSGSDDGTLRVWNMETENIPSQELTGHTNWIKSVTFSRDGSLVASASNDCTIRLWDCKTWNALGKPLTNGSAVYSVAFSPDGSRLVSGGTDNTVRIWNVETRSAVGEPWKEHTDAVNSVTFSPNGTFIFSASYDRTIRCWDALTGNPIGRPLEGHSIDITSLAVSPDGHRIVSGSEDRTVRVWESQSFTWEVDTSFITCGHRGPNKIPDYIPEDGWIHTTEGRLLLWVPVEHRSSVCRLYAFAISTDDRVKPNRILWDEICHGEKWTVIRHAK